MRRLKSNLFVKLERVGPLRIAGQLHHSAVALFRETDRVLDDRPAEPLPLMAVRDPHRFDERPLSTLETQIGDERHLQTPDHPAIVLGDDDEIVGVRINLREPRVPADHIGIPLGGLEALTEIKARI